MKNFVEKGNRIAYVNTTGVAILAGAVVIIGSIIGIAESDIAIAGTGTVCVEGVYSLGKTAGLVITQGDRLFFNTSTKLITKTATDVPIGTAFESELAGSDTVNVNIYENSPEGNPQAAVVAALSGTLTGTTDGALANVANIACGGGATPSATDVNTAVNGAILDVNLQLKELQTALNAALASLKAAGLMASA
jgi:predicted RecA/RadA family phage recombinase